MIRHNGDWEGDGARDEQDVAILEICELVLAGYCGTIDLDSVRIEVFTDDEHPSVNTVAEGIKVYHLQADDAVRWALQYCQAVEIVAAARDIKQHKEEWGTRWNWKKPSK